VKHNGVLIMKPIQHSDGLHHDHFNHTNYQLVRYIC